VNLLGHWASHGATIDKSNRKSGLQIWSQWVKKLTKFAPIGRDRGKSRKPMICLVGEDCGWFVRITRIDPSKANTPAFGAVPESRAQPERGGYRAAIGARAQVRALATYRSGAYRASKGLRPFCRQSLEMTSRFSSQFSLLSAAIAPPIIFPFSVLIVARKRLHAGIAGTVLQVDQAAILESVWWQTFRNFCPLKSDGIWIFKPGCKAVC